MTAFMKMSPSERGSRYMIRGKPETVPDVKKIIRD